MAIRTTTARTTSQIATTVESTLTTVTKIAVRDYFREEGRQGRCPPGLAKKNNGCNPPGQVKRWQLGQPLQREITYHALPNDLINLLGRPQPGYHYGIVDTDILLLIDGTEIVFDAIMSLGQ